MLPSLANRQEARSIETFYNSTEDLGLSTMVIIPLKCENLTELHMSTDRTPFNRIRNGTWQKFTTQAGQCFQVECQVYEIWIYVIRETSSWAFQARSIKDKATRSLLTIVISKRKLIFWCFSFFDWNLTSFFSSHKCYTYIFVYSWYAKED